MQKIERERRGLLRNFYGTLAELSRTGYTGDAPISRSLTMARPAAAYRLEASVTDAQTVQKAKRLMALLHTGNADLFRGALDILDWCVRQAQEGRHVASIDDQGGMTRELSTPLLDAVRPLERMVLQAESFDRVVEILKGPAEPTPELRALMAEAYARQAPVPA